MRLRLLDGGTELAVVDVESSEVLGEKLAVLETDPALPAARHLQVHLWHGNTWWNLSDDLSEFFVWLIDSGAATLHQAKDFAEAPLSRPDWLFEAARQMKTLLAVTGQRPPDRASGDPRR